MDRNARTVGHPKKTNINKRAKRVVSIENKFEYPIGLDLNGNKETNKVKYNSNNEIIL